MDPIQKVLSEKDLTLGSQGEKRGASFLNKSPCFKSSFGTAEMRRNGCLERVLASVTLLSASALRSVSLSVQAPSTQGTSRHSANLRGPDKASGRQKDLEAGDGGARRGDVPSRG